MRYHFGPLHLDATQGVLFRGSDIVPLPPKVFSILLVLLEDAGRVVSRDILRERVWGDAFVEEANISKNVSHLRSVLRIHLGDVEALKTITKRGYQFAVPVTVQDESESSPAHIADAPPVPSPSVGISPPDASSAELPQVFADSIYSQDPETAAQPRPDSEIPTPSATSKPSPLAMQTARPPRRKRLGSLVGLGLAATLLLTAAVVSTSRYKVFGSLSTSKERPSLAVFDPNDLSSDPAQHWLATGLQEALTADLQRGSGVRLVSADRASRASRDLALPTLHAFDEHSVKALGQRLDCDFVIVGFYLPAGSEVRLDLQLRNAHTGVVVSEFTRIFPLDHLYQVASDATASFRAALNLPAETATTPQGLVANDAVRDYTEGLRLWRSGDPINAQPALSKAVMEDPHSALAHIALAGVWHNLGYSGKIAAEAHLALDNVASVPQQQRLMIQARAYTLLNDWPHALETYATLHRLYPDDPQYPLALADTQMDAGLLKESGETLRQIRSNTNPSHPPDPQLPVLEAYLADAQGDHRAELLHAGQAIEEARATGSRFSEGEALILEGIAWSDLGDRPRGLADFRRAQQIATDIHDLGGIAIALQRQGDVLQKSNDPQTEPILKQALAISTQMGASDITADILLTLGNSRAELSDWAAASVYYHRALDLALQIDSILRLPVILGNLSSLSLNIGDPNAAMQYGQRALQAARQQGDLVSVAADLNWISAAEIYSGHLADAHLHLQQAIDTSTPLGDPARTAELVQCMSTLELQMGNIATARTLAERVASQHLLNGSPEETRQINDATLELETRPESAAQTVLPPMTALAQQTAAPDNEAEAWRMVAEVRLLQGDLAKSHEAVARALAVAKKSPYSATFLLPSRLFVARLHIAEGHPSEALTELNALLPQAQHLHDAGLQLDIRLNQAIAQGKLGDRPSLLRNAKAVQADATRQGFGLLAAKAQRAAS